MDSLTRRLSDQGRKRISAQAAVETNGEVQRIRRTDRVVT